MPDTDQACFYSEITTVVCSLSQLYQGRVRLGVRQTHFTLRGVKLDFLEGCLMYQTCLWS